MGPFPLPDVDREAHIRAEARKWRDLGRAEKVARTGSNVGGFFVVVAGAGLVAAVGYSFGSELFAENSPTRVFEDATERVKESHEVSGQACTTGTRKGATDERLGTGTGD